MRFLDIFNLSELFYKKANEGNEDWKTNFVPPPSKALALIRAGFFDNKGKFSFDEIKVQQNSDEIKNLIRDAINVDKENFKKQVSGDEKQEFANQKLNELVVNYVDNILNNINNLNKMRSGLYYMNNVIKISEKEDHWLNNFILLGNKLLNDLESISLSIEKKATIQGSIRELIDEAEKGSTGERVVEKKDITIYPQDEDNKINFNKNAEAFFKLAKAKSFKLEIEYPFINKLHESVNSITSVISRSHNEIWELVPKQAELSHLVDTFKENLSKNLSNPEEVNRLKDSFKKVFLEKASQIFDFIILNNMIDLNKEGDFSLIKEKITNIDDTLKNATIQTTIEPEKSAKEERKEKLEKANQKVSRILHGAATPTANKLREDLLARMDSFDEEKPTQEQIYKFDNADFPGNLKSKEHKIKEFIKKLDYKAISYINYLAEELKKIDIKRVSSPKDNLIEFARRLREVSLIPKQQDKYDFNLIGEFITSLNDDLNDFTEVYLKHIQMLTGTTVVAGGKKISEQLIGAIRSLLAGKSFNVEEELNKYLGVPGEKVEAVTPPQNPIRRPPAAKKEPASDQNAPPNTPGTPDGLGANPPPNNDQSQQQTSDEDARKEFFEKISTDIGEQISAFAAAPGKTKIFKSEIAPKFIEKIKQVIAAISEARSNQENRTKLSGMIDKFISIVNKTESEEPSFFDQDVNAAKIKNPNKKDLLIEALKKIKSLLQLSDDQLKEVKDQDTLNTAIATSQGSGSSKPPTPPPTAKPRVQKTKVSKPATTESAAKSKIDVKKRIAEISKNNNHEEFNSLIEEIEGLDPKSIQEIIEYLDKIKFETNSKSEQIAKLLVKELIARPNDEDQGEGEDDQDQGQDQDQEDGAGSEEIDQEKYREARVNFEKNIKKINESKIRNKKELIQCEIESFFNEMNKNLSAIEILKESIASIGESNAKLIKLKFGMSLENLIQIIDSFIEENSENKGVEIEVGEDGFGGSGDPRKFEHGRRYYDDDDDGGGEDEDDDDDDGPREITF